MHCKLLLLLLFYASGLCAQVDSVMYAGNPADGIYLTYNDFRHNRFIAKEQVVSSLDREQLEFTGKSMDANVLTYTTSAGTFTADTRSAWGFFQNKTLYVNFRGDFYRVPVFGSICYLVATVTVINSGFYDPMFGYGMSSTRSQEIHKFIMNVYDGVMVEFTIEGAEQLLSRDPVVFAEYKKLKHLSRRKREEQVNRFIRQFNELHPVYFLN